MPRVITSLREHLTRLIAVALVIAVLPVVVAGTAHAARIKTIRIADASIVETDASTQNLSFTISWTGSKGGASPSVGYATTDVSATAGDDYTTVSGTATLTNGGCRCKVITVPIKGDTTTEGTETFQINLSNPTNGTIDDAQAIGTIYDNEGSPALVVGDTSANEATGMLTFTVQLTNASASTVTVDYATGGGTALAGTDYTAANGGLTFSAGQLSKMVDVTVADESLSEDDETVLMTLSNAANASIADSQSTGSIVNDDADPTVGVSDALVSEADGVATFTISLDAASGRETAVDYTTSDGTAVAGQDYTSTSGSVTIAAGDTSATFDVTLAADGVHEGADETFAVTLSGEVNLTLGDATGSGIVTDADPMPTLDVVASSAGESDGSATVTFKLTGPSVADVTFDWATGDGSATAGSDYTAASGSATIPAGSTSVTADIALLPDTDDEPAETVTVTPSNVVGASDGGPGTLTISDDDPSATTLTGKTAKTKRSVKAKGLLEPAVAGLKVKVTLQRKKGARWVKVGVKTVTVKGVKDRDTDGANDAQYVASFPKPSRGAYRFKVVFAGTAGLLASTRVIRFRV